MAVVIDLIELKVCDYRYVLLLCAILVLPFIFAPPAISFVLPFKIYFLLKVPFLKLAMFLFVSTFFFTMDLTHCSTFIDSLSTVEIKYIKY